MQRLIYWFLPAFAAASVLLCVALVQPSAPTTSARNFLQTTAPIAFQTNRNGVHTDIYTMNEDGSNQNLLIAFDSESNEGTPAWSPDGEKIAFSSNYATPDTYNIYVANADGSSPFNLTTMSGGSSNTAPTWSPDGKQIAFESNRNNNTDIYIINVDGTGLTRLTTHTATDGYPAWSPDGERIAFQSERSGNSEIYTIKLDGSDLTNLTGSSVDEYHPAWSPDGNQLAYARYSTDHSDIYVMNANGSNPTNKTNYSTSYEWAPTWTNEGNIVFSTDRNDNREIYLLDGSGEQINLTNTLGDDQFPTCKWTPPLSPTPTIPITSTPGITTTPTIISTPGITTTPTIISTPGITTTPTITSTPGITTTPTIISTPTSMPEPTNTPTPTPTPTPTSNALPESPDYASLYLRNPWDMTEYSDVSYYINASGTELRIHNPRIENGVFKGTSNGANSASFSLIHPGFSPATVDLDLDGSQRPIPSSFSCLYFAMKVDSAPVVAGNPDQYQIYWFPDQTLGNAGMTYGVIHPEQAYGTPGVQPANNWKLFHANLANPTYGGNENLWTSQPTWQGISLRPINHGNTSFEIDWARLTPCTPNTTRITWTPDPAVSAIWIQPSGTNRAIRVAPLTDRMPLVGIDGSSGSYDLDIQGIPPGTYQVGLGTLTAPPTTWQNDPLIINQSPIATFDRPSFSSGEDYATTMGNPWDFSDASDTPKVESPAEPGKLQWAYETDETGNGYLSLVSPSGTQVFDIDSQVHLNIPEEFSNSDYRYLSFRMYTEWRNNSGAPIPWANGLKGMVARWIWIIPSLSLGEQGYACTLVGEDIPYDIGWRTYKIDLYTTVNGRVEDMSPMDPVHCPTGGGASWATTPKNIIGIRFDPNENVSQHPVYYDPVTGGGTYYQKLDWIKLTKVDAVQQGATFPVELSLNEAIASGNTTVYYTTDPATPTQNQAVIVSEENGSSSVAGTPYRAVSQQEEPNMVYLPLVRRGGAGTASDPLPSLAANQKRLMWDTSSVAPGTYYVCVRVDDGVNQPVYCSRAPLNVIAP